MEDFMEDYELIKNGYSVEIVCSIDEPKYRNKSCRYYHEGWAGNCGDMLNCQPCPRQKLK